MSDDVKPSLLAKRYVCCYNVQHFRCSLTIEICSMVGLILRNVRKKHPTVHYSYGDDLERPHVVVPAWTLFDRMVVTRGTDEPPEMDQLFPEPPKSVAARQASASNGAWNTTSTYSFSFSSRFVDFPEWKLINLIFSHDIDLHMFWGNAPIRLVLYEHRDGVVAPDHHLQQFNFYLMMLQVSCPRIV